jgi:hypothetical protein
MASFLHTGVFCLALFALSFTQAIGKADLLRVDVEDTTEQGLCVFDVVILLSRSISFEKDRSSFQIPRIMPLTSRLLLRFNLPPSLGACKVPTPSSAVRTRASRPMTTLFQTRLFHHTARLSRFTSPRSLRPLRRLGSARERWVRNILSLCLSLTTRQSARFRSSLPPPAWSESTYVFL